MVWSREGLSSLGFSYCEFGMYGGKGRLNGKDPSFHYPGRRDLQESSKVKSTNSKQVIMRNACEVLIKKERGWRHPHQNHHQNE